MKRSLCLLFSLLLTACGGGSGDAGSAPAKVNTAPILVGPLSMQLTATTVGETNLALQDAENDTLTLSYTDKPSWVEAVATGNQLKFTARPGLFHIGTTKFSVRLSDGKANADYSITLNVADDPTKWVQIATPKADFIGQWSLSTGDDLHLYENDTGRFFAADGDVYDLTWSARSGYIEISSKKTQCVTDCDEQIEAFVIANEGNRKRIVLESDAEKIAAIITPYQTKTLKNGFYVQKHVAVDYVTTMQNNMVHFYAPFQLQTPQSSLNGWGKVSSALTSDGKIAAQAAIDDLSMNLYRVGGGQEQVGLVVNLTSAEVLPAAADRLTVKYQLGITLKDATVKAENFIGLKELLEKPYIGVVEFSFAEKLAVPAIALNTPYHSAFRLKTEIDGQLFEFGASEVVFTDSSKGIARFRKADTATVIERNFTWSQVQQQLVLKLDDKEYRYEFIKHPVHGVSLLTPNELFYPFLVNDKPYQISDLVGNYMTEKYTSSDWTSYHNIFADNTAQLFSNQLEFNSYGQGNHKWQQEQDGSITVLYGWQCDRSMTFTSCAAHLERRFKQGESVTISYRNFKIVKKTDNYTYVQSSYSFQSKTQRTMFESVVRWINVKK